MRVDDELCMCFHVSWRKVMNFIRIHQVKIPSQLAECQSAGTGCGWCRSAMRRLVQRMQDAPPSVEDLQRWLDEEYSASRDYAAGRQSYLQAGKGKPPSE